MLNHALKDINTLPTLENGRVISQNSAGFWVAPPTGRILAQKAVSCLITPLPGDYVLMSSDTTGAWYILAVLTRDENENTTTDLEFTGPVNLKIKKAGLTVESEGEISLASGIGLSLVQPRISLEAEEGQAAIGRMSFLGRTLKTKIGLIESVAENVEQVFARLTQKMVDHFRYVNRHEEVQTNTTRYLVEDTLTIQARQAEYTAEEMIKINAEQIHMG